MKQFLALSLSDVVFIMLINVKMPTFVGILTFMSRINFVLCWVEHGKSFITFGPVSALFSKQDISWLYIVKITKLFNVKYFRNPVIIMYFRTEWKTKSGFIQARLCKIQGFFKDFQKTFLLFSRTENLRKILIYTLKFYFGNARVHY